MTFIRKDRHKYPVIYDGCITKRAYKENTDVDGLAPTRTLMA